MLNAFKTPGKLRGRTPYTGKKRFNQGNRAVCYVLDLERSLANRQQPLTDIFAPNPQASSPNKASPGKTAVQFNIAEDGENRQPYRLSPPKPIPHPSTRIEYSKEKPAHEGRDQMDIGTNEATIASEILHSRQGESSDEPSAPPSPVTLERRRTTNETFVSAEENPAGAKVSEDAVKVDSQVIAPTVQPELDTMDVDSLPQPQVLTQPNLQYEQTEATISNEDVMDLDEVRSPSESPSPLKPVVRKSSLTFAALPAREPLAKTSFGPRTSHIDASKSFGGRASQLNRMTGSRTTGGASQLATTASQAEKDHVELGSTRPVLDREESETTKMHHKTSTQRLHDKINMLGQARDIRTSKSQLNASFDKPQYSQIAPVENESQSHKNTQPQLRQVVDDDDEWIRPLTRGLHSGPILPSKEADFVDQVSNKLANIDEQPIKRSSPSRPFLHKKMASTTVLASPTRAAMAPDMSLQKPISVSNPTPNLNNTTTPTGSPPRSPSGRRLLDGPLSASKAKFYSVLKSAKGIFASSAGISAHAKMEALSPGRVKKVAEGPLSPPVEARASPAVLPNHQPTVHSPVHPPASPLKEGRRTRSSTEQKRKEEEQRRRAADDLEKAREKERQKAAASATSKMNPVRPVSKIASSRAGALSRPDITTKDDDAAPPPPPKNTIPTVQGQQRIREARRVPVPRVNKDASSKAKPAPVTLRMPSQRIGHAAPSNAILNQSLNESLPPPPPPKPNANMKSSGMTTHSNTSTTSVKSNANTKRALDAAAKKKELEAKAAQRKADQKREIEQKRAQRLEEERKLELQRKAAEQQRVQEARKAAQRQAEEAKRIEQQRREAQRPGSRQNNLARLSHPKTPEKAIANLRHQTSALQQEHAKHPSTQRGDVGGTKPLGKVNLVHDPQRPIIQVNPAKPPKRAMQFDDDSASQRPPNPRNPPSYQQLDTKRRKTQEEEPVPDQERRSVMQPPVRQSNIRKVSLSAITRFKHSKTETGQLKVYPVHEFCKPTRPQPINVCEHGKRSTCPANTV
jgi:hypothetical protein